MFAYFCQFANSYSALYLHIELFLIKKNELHFPWYFCNKVKALPSNSKFKGNFTSVPVLTESKISHNFPSILRYFSHSNSQNQNTAIPYSSKIKMHQEYVPDNYFFLSKTLLPIFFISSGNKKTCFPSFILILYLLKA